MVPVFRRKGEKKEYILVKAGDSFDQKVNVLVNPERKRSTSMVEETVFGWSEDEVTRLRVKMDEYEA